MSKYGNQRANPLRRSTDGESDFELKEIAGYGDVWIKIGTIDAHIMSSPDGVQCAIMPNTYDVDEPPVRAYLSYAAAYELEQEHSNVDS